MNIFTKREREKINKEREKEYFINKNNEKLHKIKIIVNEIYFCIMFEVFGEKIFANNAKKTRPPSKSFIGKRLNRPRKTDEKINVFIYGNIIKYFFKKA